LEELVKLLPDLNSIKMHLLPERKNWLPFYWNGFSETTRYTFRLKDLSNPRLFESMKGSVRRQVKKASKSIRIEFNDDIERFYQINASSFNRQNMEIPYSLDFLKRIDRAVEDQRIILLGRDEKDNVHAGLYITWDRNCAYYLMGGLNPEYQSSGAKSLLFWEAIKYTSSFVSEFDFEGSMICSIENFFSSFGATQVPYHQVYKDNRSVSVKVISCLKKLL
jgi:lipid II:glycine glycyltransferase (peptidoglycan interpeptide bridge formation enzyme)